MARGQRKTVEEKIAEKEEVILTLQSKLKAEQSGLDALYKEKREKELEGISQLLETSGLSTEEAFDILQEYVQNQAAGELPA